MRFQILTFKSLVLETSTFSTQGISESHVKIRRED